MNNVLHIRICLKEHELHSAVRLPQSPPTMDEKLRCVWSSPNKLNCLGVVCMHIAFKAALNNGSHDACRGNFSV